MVSCVYCNRRKLPLKFTWMALLKDSFSTSRYIIKFSFHLSKLINIITVFIDRFTSWQIIKKKSVFRLDTPLISVCFRYGFLFVNRIAVLWWRLPMPKSNMFQFHTQQKKNEFHKWNRMGPQISRSNRVLI